MQEEIKLGAKLVFVFCSRCVRWFINGLWQGLDEEDWGYGVDVRLVTTARLAGQTGHTSTITCMTTVPVLTMILTMMTIISVTIITTDTWPNTPPVQRPSAKRLQVNLANTQ